MAEESATVLIAMQQELVVALRNEEILPQTAEELMRTCRELSNILMAKKRGAPMGGMMENKRPRVELTGESASEQEILQAIETRNQYRMAKDFANADLIRDQLAAKGVTVDDRAERWSCTDGRSGMIMAPNGGRVGGQARGPATFGAVSFGGAARAPVSFGGAARAPVMGGMAAGGNNDAEVNNMIMMRENYRQAHDFASADRIRDSLKAMGVNVDDRKECWTGPDGRVRPLQTANGGRVGGNRMF